MKNGQLLRNYLKSDAALLRQASSLHSAMLRDKAVFATQKVGAAERNALRSARSAFTAFPTDAALQQPVAAAVVVKNGIRTALFGVLEPIRDLAQRAWEQDSDLYRMFGFEALEALSDNELYRAARRIARLCIKMRVPLREHGFQASLVTRLSEKATVFDHAIDAVESAVEDRDLYVRERDRLGSTLCECMQHCAAIGKNLFRGQDAARYNDYAFTLHRL